MISRSSCCICGYRELMDMAIEIKCLPVYMGVSSSAGQELYADLVFVECEKCATIQTKNLVPLDILYHANHNIDTVGRIWEEHFDQFSEFIKLNCDTSNVVEIGDPSAKIARRCSHERWTIIEPNPSSIEAPKTVSFIRQMFSDDFCAPEKYSAVVMSHILEHAFEPYKMLLGVRRLIKPGGSICLSIPDMESFAKERQLPPLGMHFEHTYFIDIPRASELLRKSGFSVRNIYRFNNHSIFIHAIQSDEIFPAQLNFKSYSKDLIDIISWYRSIAENVRASQRHDKGPIYIYGAHISAQMLLSMGLDPSTITAVLDNSISKIGKRLYGTKLMVKSPREIMHIDKPNIICHMGPYTDEIKRQLTEINKECVFI